MRATRSRQAWSIRLLIILALVGWEASSLVISQVFSEEHLRRWTFDSEVPGTLPDGFVVGKLFDGRPAGDWRVIEATAAPSPPNVLAQLYGKGAEHAYKILLVKNVEATDLNLEVSFLAMGGQGDMGGGLIWRAADDRNYYLMRANPLEQNIRIYRVVKGVRQLLQNFDQTITVQQWHRLRILTKGCQVQVFYDERPVFDLCDQAFSTGWIGLWTKSDAVTYFDDLTLRILK